MDTPTLPKGHQYSRTEARWTVCFLTPQNKILGETQNISPQGALVSCEELPPPEDSFIMLLKPPDRQALNLTGKVVWTTVFCQDDGSECFGADVRFVSISENDRKYLQSAIATICKEEETGEVRSQPLSPEVVATEQSGPSRAGHIADISMPVFYNKSGKKVKAAGSRFSTRGCHLYTKLAPPTEAVFSLKIRNPRTGKSIKVDSSVIKSKRYAAKNRWGMIIRFMNLTKTDREEIQQILQDASGATKTEKGIKYLKTKIGQAILGNFSRKKSIP